MQQSGKSRRVRCAPAMACCVWLVGAAMATNSRAQDTFQTKAKSVATNAAAYTIVDPDGNHPPAGMDQSQPVTSPDGRIHRVVRIEDIPWIEAVTADPNGDPIPPQVALEGVKHLQFVPPNGVLVSAPSTFDTDFYGPVFKLEGKLSGEVSTAPAHFVAVFHPDVDLNAVRGRILNAGARVEERPDMRAGELLIAGGRQAAETIANLDETAWIYPASNDLIQGAPVLGCPGATTPIGMVGEYVANVGEGWDGAGQGPATLQYAFQSFSAKIPASQLRSEFERALAEWSSRAQIDFVAGGSAITKKHLNVMFGARSHGDSYPFDGPGKVLAHTFYPSPPNPEPLAGDLHFDEDENWKVGADIDFYSVALHELGHALGLGHSDRPSAVMYAYYRRATTLTEDDISAIQRLYATRKAAAPTTPSAAPPTTPVTPTPAPAPTPAAPTPTPPVTPTPTPTTPTAANPTPTAPPPPNPSSDTVPPSLTLTAPTGSSALTTAASINVAGTAKDNVRVARITWQLRGGVESPADGTDQWTARDIPLIKGTNAITVRAYDAAGNSSWRSVTVTRR